ncbi:MAG: DUF3375 family protein, partial [Verrucomicrobiota bacterium]
PLHLLAQMRRLDWQELRTRVNRATEREASVSLPQLLALHPPENGAVEVLAYIQVAEEGDHWVEPDEAEEILLPAHEEDPARTFLIPRVVFRR